MKFVASESPGDSGCSVAPSGTQHPCRQVAVIYLCPEAPDDLREPPA